MKKHWTRRLLILAILIACAVWLEPTRVVWGWMRGDAFYQGRPTSWWAAQIAAWEFDQAFESRQYLSARPKNKTQPALEFDEANPPSLILRSETAVVVHYRLRHDSLRNWLECYVKVPPRQWPAILDSAATAEPVLRQLQSHCDPFVQEWAKIGLERLETLEKGARLTLWLERTRRTANGIERIEVGPVHVPGKDFSAADMQQLLLP